MRKECMLPVAPGSIAGDRWQPHLSLEHCLRGFTDAIDTPGARVAEREPKAESNLQEVF
jgi:hypothetical protein